MKLGNTNVVEVKDCKSRSLSWKVCRIEDDVSKFIVFSVDGHYCIQMLYMKIKGAAFDIHEGPLV